MKIIVLLLALVSFGLAQGKGAKKQICITFNDLPVVRVDDHIERMIITDEILYALDEFKIQAAGFVIGDNIKGHFDLLDSWLAAGHILGNHTYSHPDINEVPPALYIKDIEKGHLEIEELLKKHKQRDRYFRYPFLHYGSRYKNKKAVAEYIDDQGYIVAHVSIDTDDFAYNLQYEKIHEKADSIEIIQLGNEYIDHILEKIEDAEKLSQELLGRQVKHILLLHANRINTSFLLDLLAEIQALDYEFISFDEAISDPLYFMMESYTGPKGLSYLERLAISDPDMLPAKE